MTVLIILPSARDDVGFGFEVHGQVRMRPVAQHAQTNEVFTLAVNLRSGIFPRHGRGIQRREFRPAYRTPARLSAR